MPARFMRVSALLMFCSSLTGPALAENQTPTVSPVNVGSTYPHHISLRTFDFGAAPRPTLQSFASGTYDGKWVMLAGRTNGLHGFGQSGSANFPAASQNRDVWVIDGDGYRVSAV